MCYIVKRPGLQCSHLETAVIKQVVLDPMGTVGN